MKSVKISDVTLKLAASACSLSFKEKIEVAKLLDKIGVSVIELPEIQNPKIDSLQIKSIASAVNTATIAVPVQLSEESVNSTWNALQHAKSPRLQVCTPTSSVQMEYLFHKKPDAMLTAISDTVAACKKHCKDVEYIADDATRSDPTFLKQAIETAIQAGATTVTICDTAGTMLPNEFADFVENICESVPKISNVALGVSCSNSLAMADSAIMASISHVAEIKAAAYSSSTASLENIAKIFHARSDSIGTTCSINITQLSRATAQILWLCQTGRSKNSPFDNGVRDDEAIGYLTAHDDISGVLKSVERLGYDLSDEDGKRVYDAFLTIAAKKEKVSEKELDAIVASAAMQVPATYVLDTYVITSGNTISATAHLKLRKHNTVLEGVCIGDGPIDAAFLAIESITGQHYELDDFQIQSITEGREAMGETIVKLRSNGKLFSGKGISTDIVGASIYAYISALNKIVYEEDEV